MLRFFTLCVATTLACGLVEGAKKKNVPPKMNAVSMKELALREVMRELWMDHVLWTREYITTAFAGQPHKDVILERLLSNQQDIGTSFAQYYGKDIGDALTALLKEHIIIAVDLIGALQAKNSAAAKSADQRWRKNANDIAHALSLANNYLPESSVKKMMHKHLDTTAKEVAAHLANNFRQSVSAYDAVIRHILEMADSFSQATVKQYPDKF